MRSILFGYYGFDNIGDEKLLDETVRLLKESFHDHRFVVAAGPVSLPFPTFNRWNLFLWIGHLIRSRYLIFGGGSVFQTKTSFFSLIYYLFIVQMAALFRCRVILLCHGWGPFKRASHERLARYILSRSHVKRSWRIPNIPFKNDRFFCDLALLQPLNSRPLNSGDSIAISMRSDSDCEALSDYFLNQNIKTIIINTQLKTLNPGVYLGDLWDTHALSLQWIVTDRFHTAVWASRHGIPWVSISNDPKLIDLASQTNQVHFNDLNHAMASLSSMEISGGESLMLWVEEMAKQRPDVKGWLHDQIAA